MCFFGDGLVFECGDARSFTWRVNERGNSFYFTYWSRALPYPRPYVSIDTPTYIGVILVKGEEIRPSVSTTTGGEGWIG